MDTLLGVRLQGRLFGRDPIVAGSRNTLAIDAQGQLLSWGWNARGTVGVGHCSPSVTKPHLVHLAKGVPAGMRVRQAAIGGWHCLAVDEGGQMYAWGGNEYGQCGIVTEKRDVLEMTPTMLGREAVMVACGGTHSLALLKSGEIWVWGEPWGDYSLEATNAPRRVDLDARDVGSVKKIACGSFHNLALTHDGRVLAWGTNDYGQLGLGATCAHTRDNRPSDVSGLEGHRVVDIAAGGWHNALVTSEGLCFTWGRGEYGRLGLGDRSGKSAMSPTLVEGLLGHFVVQVACGGSHTIALTQEGRVFIWGRGSFGRLGMATGRDAAAPVEVHLSGGSANWRVIHVAAGGRHSMVYALPLRGESPYASVRVTPRVSQASFKRAPAQNLQFTLDGGGSGSGSQVSPGPGTSLLEDEDHASDGTNNTEWENPDGVEAGASRDREDSDALQMTPLPPVAGTPVAGVLQAAPAPRPPRSGGSAQKGPPARATSTPVMRPAPGSTPIMKPGGGITNAVRSASSKEREPETRGSDAGAPPMVATERRTSRMAMDIHGDDGDDNHDDVDGEKGHDEF